VAKNSDSISVGKRRVVFSFRASITLAIMAFVIALAALLILIQSQILRVATRDAAAADMDAASAKAFGRLQSLASEIASVVGVLATSSSLADSTERTATGRGIPLLKEALIRLPQIESIYVGYDTGSWLQVQRLSDLSEQQRETLRAPPGAAFAVSVIRPTPGGALPMRRIFEDRDGNELQQLDLWNYGYDPRQRPWYIDAMAAAGQVISSPYVAFTIGAPVMTVSEPLRGQARGVIGANLKLDEFSKFVYAQRPGEHGTAMIFDSRGMLIAHPDFAKFVTDAMTHPSRPRLPNVSEIGGLAAAVLKRADCTESCDGSIRDEAGRNFLFRLIGFKFGGQSSAKMLMLAAQDDFAKGIQNLQLIAVLIAIAAGAAFIPVVWFFGDQMSRSLKAITIQAGRLQLLAATDDLPVTSNIKEIHELGITVNLAQRAISSFARFVPKELVRRVIDNSISTELGGARQEITVVFTDVKGFTTIAESADPDVLMHQTSRYFAALTEAFLAEGGTIDKFIGDSVMVFWNAPNPQPDHVERACRATLAARAASEKLNALFEAEGAPRFFTRFGIHVGDAVVGNLGSAERMNYTALGSTVNLASRLEGLNKEYGTSILVSAAVYSRVQHHFQFRAIGSVVAKGMTKETSIHELVGASG
jgi:adenylate cyclase